jgi:hypothetical protein
MSFWQWLIRLFKRKPKAITGAAVLHSQSSMLVSAGQQDIYDVGNENELPKEIK